MIKKTLKGGFVIMSVSEFPSEWKTKCHYADKPAPPPYTTLHWNAGQHLLNSRLKISAQLLELQSFLRDTYETHANTTHKQSRMSVWLTERERETTDAEQEDETRKEEKGKERNNQTMRLV